MECLVARTGRCDRLGLASSTERLPPAPEEVVDQDTPVLTAGQVNPKVHVQGAGDDALRDGRSHADHNVADFLRLEGLQ